MKSLIIIIFLTLFLIGCGDTKKKFDELDYVELTSSDLNKVSLTDTELADVDVKAQLINEGIKKQLVLPGSQDILSYRLYVSEFGNIDKVDVLHNNGEFLSVDKINIPIIMEWIFVPLIIEGDETKFRLDFIYIQSEKEEDLFKKILTPDEVASFDKEFFSEVSTYPKIVGGVQALAALIIYPKLAKESGKEGSVFVQAFISETGDVEKVMVTRGIGSGCDLAAIRAVSKIKFVPATIEGEPVKVQVLIPIKFKLENN